MDLRKEMRQAGDAGPPPVISDRLAEDRRIDQSFSPNSKSQDRSVAEDLNKLRMRDGAQHCVSHGADRVVHTLKKQALSIRPVARKMNGEILPPPVPERVVTGDNALQDDGRSLRLVA